MPNPARRVFIVVMDACGVGALPDAADYGDAGTNTLAHLAAEVGGLHLPAMERLGLGHVAAIDGVAAVAEPDGVYGRLHRNGPGKDSTTGHWELLGVVTPRALPTFPDGVPEPLLARLQDLTGRRFCANRPLNGIDAIEQWGAHHLATGDLILYTSQDSVLQVAAHEDIVEPEALYDICWTMRKALTDQDHRGVGRVIARPFRGVDGAFERLDTKRMDMSIPPPGRSALISAWDDDVRVHSVGKVSNLMASEGVDETHPGATNAIALREMDRMVGETTGRARLVVANLVDTDQVHGHRKDAAGFAQALQTIDEHVGRWLAALRPDELLILTADHGCDITASHSDHTREYVPLLAYAPGIVPGRHDGPMVDVAQTALDWVGATDPAECPGTNFVR